MELRRRRQWSNKDMMQCLGVTAVQMSRLLHGYQLASLKMAVRLAQALGADEVAFVGAALQDMVWAQHLPNKVSVGMT